MPDPEVADHAFLDGRLRLLEPRRGHRSGTDAVLLAAASRLQPGQHLIDVGAGAGAAALAALCRVEDATATLVERDTAMAALARHNVAANGFEGRAEVVTADIFDEAACRSLLARRGDVVISNPPFYLAGTVRASDVPQRVASHVLDAGGHGDWARRLLDCAAPRGRVVVIHRPEALPDIVGAARGRAALMLRSVHPRMGKPATRILVGALPGRRTPLGIEPALVLHGDDGAFTETADALHRGHGWL